MYGAMVAMHRANEAQEREWGERFNRMTRDEKLAELRKKPNMPFFAAGVNGVMLVMNILLGVKIAVGYHAEMLIVVGLMLFMGAAPIAGLHAGGHARLAKRYGVYQRTIEHTALDLLYGILVVLALGVVLNRANNFEINALLFLAGLVAQVVVFRWAFFGKSPVEVGATR